MKKLFKYFIYLSFIFLAYSLYSKGYFKDLQVSNWRYFFLSVPFLLIGFLGQGLQWWILLRVWGFKLSMNDAFISTGLPIFGKYIPGKVWLILGRATFVGRRLGISLKEVSWYSLVSQAFTLWIGLLIGSTLFLGFDGGQKYMILLVVGLVLISLFIFNPLLIRTIERVIYLLFKRSVHLPYLKPLQALQASPYFLLTWLSWSVGFYFLTSSISTYENSLWLIPSFPLAASLGIMAILVPGGLGVREGLLVGFMTLLDIDLEVAVKVSVLQRIWFLFGEVFIFMLGLALNKWKMSLDEK